MNTVDVTSCHQCCYFVSESSNFDCNCWVFTFIARQYNPCEKKRFFSEVLKLVFDPFSSFALPDNTISNSSLKLGSFFRERVASTCSIAIAIAYDCTDPNYFNSGAICPILCNCIGYCPLGGKDDMAAPSQQT